MKFPLDPLTSTTSIIPVTFLALYAYRPIKFSPSIGPLCFLTLTCSKLKSIDAVDLSLLNLKEIYSSILYFYIITLYYTFDYRL